MNEKELKEMDENKFRVNGKLAEDTYGNVIIHNIKNEDIKRNPEWPPLDWDIIEKECGHCNRFEYIMCEMQCSSNELAIKGIKNCRKHQSEYNDILIDDNRTKRRNKYIRTHYNDLEDDVFERQEIRCLNG